MDFLVGVQSLSRVRLLVTPWTAACQAFLSFTISQSLLKLMGIESMTPSNHLIPVAPFTSCSQSFPASGSFPMSQFFALSSQSFGASASASVPPINIQGWFLLRLTGLISLLSKGLSRVLSSTTVQKAPILWHSAFFTVQLSHPYKTTGKTIALTIWTNLMDYMEWTYTWLNIELPMLASQRNPLITFSLLLSSLFSKAKFTKKFHCIENGNF